MRISFPFIPFLMVNPVTHSFLFIPRVFLPRPPLPTLVVFSHCYLLSCLILHHHHHFHLYYHRHLPSSNSFTASHHHFNLTSKMRIGRGRGRGRGGAMEKHKMRQGKVLPTEMKHNNTHTFTLPIYYNKLTWKKYLYEKQGVQLIHSFIYNNHINRL